VTVELTELEADVVTVDSAVVLTVEVADDVTVETPVLDAVLVAEVDTVDVGVVLGDVISHNPNAPPWNFVIISLM